LKCYKFRKNLALLLDNEIDLKKRLQMEQHLYTCNDCSYEKEKMEEVINRFKKVSIPEVTKESWDDTRRKLLTNIEQLPIPRKTSIFRIHKWTFVPVGTIAFAILLYMFSGLLFFNHSESGPMSIDVCLEEHSLYSAEQKLPSDILTDISITEIKQTDEKTDDTESKLDTLLEAHYGIN
jgi:hypothetical protein